MAKLILSHYTVGIRRFDKIIVCKTSQPERPNVQRFRLAVDNQLGHELADNRRHFEAVPAEADGTVDAFHTRAAIEDRVPVGRDGVESPVAAAAVAAIHGRITAAQALPYLRQPAAVGRLVIIVWVHGIVDLLASD